MRLAVPALLATLIACSDDGNSAEPSVVPADFAATYQEVRNCRNSIDHDLRRIRVLASPDALMPYTTRAAPIPTGAILLKVEYAMNDTTCSGPVVEYTAMQRLDTGTAPALLDWTWQRVDTKFGVIKAEPRDEPVRCAMCHTGCGKPPEGYDGTCTMP